VKSGKEGLAGSGSLGLLHRFALETLLFEELVPAKSFGVRVETEENRFVAERVLLLCPRTLLDFLARRTDDRLDLRRVDQTGHVWVGDFSGGQEIILLIDRSLVEGSKDFVKESESTFGPDDKTSKMPTGSELKEVEPPDINNLYTGKIAESLDDTVVLVVNNKRTTALTVSAVPQFTLSCAELARVGNLHNVLVCVETLEESNSLLGLFEGLGLGGDNQRHFLNLLDTVTTSENKRRKSGGSKGRDSRETTLVLVDLDVPFAPSLGWCKHTSTSAHVTKSSLARAMSSSTANTGNTSDGTTSSPRLGGRLVSRLLAHGVRLPFVLCEAFVNLRNDIKSDWGGENRRKRERGRCLSRAGADVDCGS